MTSIARNKLPLAATISLLAILAIASVLFLSRPANVEGQTNDPPAKPTGLTGTVEHDTVALSWDDPDDNTIKAYRILRRNKDVDDPGVFHVHVGSTGSAATSYVDSDVEAETRYVYRIKARNANGLSPRSRWFNATTPAAPPPPEPETPDPPAKPTGLTNTVTHDTVTLSWDDPDDDSITGYRILRLNRAEDDLGDFHVHVENTSSPATAYTDTDVEPESRYVYRIKALNDGGESPRSSYTNADTAAAPAAPVPATPTNLFTASTHNQVLLNWSDPDDDSITGYRVLRGPDANNLTTLVDDTNSASTSYTDESVEAETTYVYALQARNSSGDSDRSETAEVTTSAAPEDEEPLIAAKQVAEISLVSNTAASQDALIVIGQLSNNAVRSATSFHTGDNADGYALTSVQLFINRQTNDVIPKVSIFSDSSGSVGTSLHALMNPSSLPLHTDNTAEITTFTAPDSTTLAADTTYWLVAEATNPSPLVYYSLRATDANNEASDDSPEWGIGDVIHRSADGAAWAESITKTIQMNIQGKLISPSQISLVSNTSEVFDSNILVGKLSSGTQDFGTSFHTGDNPDGYTLSSVQLNLSRLNANATPQIFIFSDSSDIPDESLHTLINPSTIETDGTARLTRFTATDGATLAANTTYWLVAKAVNPGNTVFYSITSTESETETSDDSPEWSIGNSHYRSLNDGAWQGSGINSIQMNIQGKLINPPGVVTFTPEHAEVGTPLMASLPNEDAQVTNVRWQWARSRDGQTSWTDIAGARTDSYTPTYADRGEYLRASASYNTPEFAKTASGIIVGPEPFKLVYNTDATATSGVSIGKPGSDTVDFSTSFHTGDNPDGYALTSVQLFINRTDSDVIPEVSIFTDNSATPGTSLHPLTNPSTLPLHESLVAFDLTTFAAPGNATLAADTTYWLVAQAVNPSTGDTYLIRRATSDDEASDDSPKWHIGNFAYLSQDNAAWSQSSSKPMQINVQGRLINPPGVVTITPEDAQVGTELTASLESPHHGVTGVTWEWSRSRDGRTDWTNISGQTTDTYTPVYADRGEYLRATASYNDNHGTGKTASAIMQGPPALALVSNTAKASSGTATLSTATYYAISFRTGNHDQGYAIRGVALVLRQSGEPFHQRVSIFTDSAGNPGTSLYSLTSTTRELSATLKAEPFIFPSGTNLEANTTYWIVAQVVDNKAYRFSYTADFAEDLTPFPGWSIGDQSKSFNTSWGDFDGGPFQIAIGGRLINPRGVITFDQPRPNIDNLLSATFTDEDGGITNLRWQWSISDDGQTGWTNISGANSAAYTPVEADAGKYLRAVVTYTDNHGSGQRAKAVSQQPVFSFRIDFTIDPGMFAYEFHATEYDPLGDFRFQWKSADVTPWPTYDQFKPTHDVEKFCAMPGINREDAMECSWEYVSPGSGVSSQLATLVTKHANREYDFRIVGELREGGELFSSTIRTMVAPDPDLSDATERGIKAWRVDTAGHFIVEWHLTQSCDSGKRFYIRTEDSGKFAWGTGGRRHGRLLFTDNATFDEDDNDVATEVSIYCATSSEDTNRGHIYATADIAAKGADPVLGNEVTR